MIQKYVSFILLAYLATFSAYTLVTFFREWGKISTIKEGMERAKKRCEDQGIMEDFSATCLLAKEYSTRNPLLDSLSVTIESMYSCGFVSCQEVALSLLGSTPGIIFTIVLAGLCCFILFGALERYFVQKRMHEYSPHGQQNRVPGAVVYDIKEVQHNGSRFLAISEPPQQQLTSRKQFSYEENKKMY